MLSTEPNDDLGRDGSLDAELCYRAVLARDQRFDGRFFTAVTTTGVFCRPICPARAPHRANVRFFRCAAAAHESGFRPCRRCRPEAAPGSPAWIGTSSSVARALELIADGALDDANVDTLADRLGLTSRHIRRLFDQQLGTSPVAIAQVRRVHFAKRLIDETTLRISEIAFASGFSSVRRFNAVYSDAFGRSPSSTRRDRIAPAARDSAALKLRIACRAPFAGMTVLKFLAARAIPGVEAVTNDCYLRTFRDHDASGTVQVRVAHDACALDVAIPAALARSVRTIVTRVRKLFDTDADSTAIVAHLSADPLLARIARRIPGVRVPGAWDPFETAVRTILGQQISVKAATTIAGRVAARYGARIESPDLDPAFVFPSADVLAEAPLDRIGVPAARANTIRAFSAAISSGALSLTGHASFEHTIDSLEAIPGIGPWTAHAIAMRACGEPDAFPASDLGIRYALDDHSHGARMSGERRTESWRPWRSYATILIWCAADGATKKER